MNDEFSKIEQLLARASGSVALSSSETAEGKNALRAYMKKTRKPQPSWLRAMTHVFRGALALALITASGSGAALAAEGSLPGDTLYPLKVKVTEPLRAALAATPQKRAEFEIERAHRRLLEYAHVSVDDGATPALEADLAESLTTHVGDAADAIAVLSESGEVSEALAAAANLTATLETHVAVLDLVSEDESASHPVEEALTLALDGAHELASSSEEVIEEVSDDEVAEAIDDSQKEVASLAQELSSDVSVLNDAFDAADAKQAEEELARVSMLVEAAKKAEEAGDLPKALIIYTDANKKLSELSILIEADAELGVDVLGATEE